MLAPAKVNLSLRVLGRRPDGYHLVESLMVPISLYDRLEIAVFPGARGVSCRVTGPERVAGGAGNLAAIAARAVIDEIGGRARIELRLDKEVPAGAGLGGGVPSNEKSSKYTWNGPFGLTQTFIHAL